MKSSIDALLSNDYLTSHSPFRKSETNLAETTIQQEKEVKKN